VGYTPYVESVRDLTAGKELIATGMRQEKERCQAALTRASEGAVVALISSGDPGIYGMAGLAVEMAEAAGCSVPIEIVPGVSAAQAAAARLGAPLALDYACVSLSDLLVSWETIRVRLQAAAQGDFVTALYNPRSMRRVAQLEEAVEIFSRFRSASTPVGVVTAAATDEEVTVMTTLAEVLRQDIGMRTVVIIGNSTSRHNGAWFVTPRGYAL
jgi:precorrin-3B C17-methyltransferase